MNAEKKSYKDFEVHEGGQKNPKLIPTIDSDDFEPDLDFT